MKKPLKIVLALVIIGIVFLVAYGLGQGDPVKPETITGRQIWEAVNAYRSQNGQPALPIEENACDNLVERFLAVSRPDSGHKGYEEWVIGEGLDKLYAPIAELYVTNIKSPENAIEFWSSSPGHKTTLLNETFTGGCAYANKVDETGLNAAVVILVKKK